MERFDPFAVFGLPRRYDVDLAAVEREYLRRSAALHPDMLGEEGMAGEEFSQLDRARRVLEDPEQRAIALWRLWGGVEDKTLPPGLLMEMMEVREEMEGAGEMDAAVLRKWEEWAEQRRGEYQRKVGWLLARLSPGDAGNAAVLSQIKIELNGWRYIERLVEQLG
jgi:molecular chaperone HscB